jgi:hypothetical protein
MCSVSGITHLHNMCSVNGNILLCILCSVCLQDGAVCVVKMGVYICTTYVIV